MFDESDTPWQFAMSFSGDAFVADGPRADAWQPAWGEKRPQPTTAKTAGAAGTRPAPSPAPSAGEAGSSNG